MSSASSQHSAPSKHVSTDGDENGISRVQIEGTGGEFVIINGQKFYRHELMAAFGGTLNTGAMPYPKLNINPAPIGLSGLAITLFVLGLFNARAMGITIPNGVVSLACFYGGMIQFLAGLFEFLTGNTFGLTALVSLGSFCLSYAAIFIENFGIAAAYAETDQFGNAVGFFLLAWALIIFVLTLLTLKSTWGIFLMFLFLTLMFLLLCGGSFVGKVGVNRAGGVIGVITAFITWYNAYAGVATRTNSYLVPHPIAMPHSIPFKKHK